MKKNFYVCLSTALCILLCAAVSCSKDETDPKKPDGPHNEWTDIDKQMDDILDAYYLWNDEYKTLSPDFLLKYDQFLSEMLLGMTTNTMDKKLRNGTYRLYSFIQQLSPIGRTSSPYAVDHGLQKEPVYGFGAYNMSAIAYTDQNGNKTGEYGLALEGVYPDTPLAKAGIRRGAILVEVDGQKLTDANINRFYTVLLYPDPSAQVSLTVDGISSPYRITAELMYENPVLCTKVLTDDSHKVGYLAYAGFDAAYDDELLQALATLKAKGINDMVLDLRLNGGGHVISSRMLASCLAGSPCEGKVFQYYRYNDDRMADPTQTSRQTGMDYDAAVNRFYENFVFGEYYGEDIKQYALDLPRLYVVVSSSTASASEAVINSLRGIGIPVTLIGGRTNGKNVGMESRTLSSGSYDYFFAPISFQGYNALLETVDPSGLIPDWEVQDWNNGYADFGETTDPCLAQAMSLITEKDYAPSAPRTAAAPRMRLAEHITLPDRPERLEGMIILPHGSKPER